MPADRAVFGESCVERCAKAAAALDGPARLRAGELLQPL